MAYSGFVTKITNVKKDPNSDRLYTATALGDSIIVGGDSKDGDIVLYLPQDGAVSYEFGIKFNLFRKDKDGNKLSGYLDANGHIKALKLRGLRSEGIAIPIDKVAKYYSDIDYIEVGMPITKLNNEVIVQKYVPRVKENRAKVASPATNRKAELAAKYPYFTQHIDTPQLRYQIKQLKAGDILTLTEKCHGTSQRFAKTLTVTPRKLFGIIPLKPKKEYTYISGTRRVIKEKGHDGTGFYGQDESFRLWADLQFNDKLLDGEQVYFEVVGYTENGTPIMPSGDVKLKEYYGLYGKKMEFSYGCQQEIGESTVFVYRMNRTLEDGTVIEYPTWKVQRRCEEMNVNFVPVLKQLIFTNAEDLIAEITAIAGEGNPSTIDPSHVMEGVVVRKENSDTFSAFKDKTFLFKVVEGIIKESALAPDREEAEGELGDE